MPSEKQIDTVARMLDPDAFTLEKTMLLMKGEMFGHHGERVRAARGKAEELLTAAEQAEPATDVEPVAYGVNASNTMRFSSVYLACDYEYGDLGSYRKDLIVPLFTRPSASEARLREALGKIARGTYDGLEVTPLSAKEARDIARAALKEASDERA